MRISIAYSECGWSMAREVYRCSRVFLFTLIFALSPGQVEVAASNLGFVEVMKDLQ